MVEKKTVGSRILQGFFVVILVILALSCLLPLLYNLAVSFSSKEAAEAGLVTFWPVGFTLQAYKEIMGEKAFCKKGYTLIGDHPSGAYHGGLSPGEDETGICGPECDPVDVCFLHAVFRRNDPLVYGHEKIWPDQQCFRPGCLRRNPGF